MVEIHQLLSNMIGLYSLLLGGWSLINYLRRRPPDGSFNGALATAVGLYALEGLQGVVLVLTGLMPPRWVHFLYGLTIMRTAPAIFAFTRASHTPRGS